MSGADLIRQMLQWFHFHPRRALSSVVLVLLVIFVRRPVEEWWKDLLKERRTERNALDGLRKDMWRDLGVVLSEARLFVSHVRERPFSNYPEPAGSLIDRGTVKSFYEEINLTPWRKTADRVMENQEKLGTQGKGFTRIDGMLRNLPGREAPIFDNQVAIRLFLPTAEAEAKRSGFDLDAVERSAEAHKHERLSRSLRDIEDTLARRGQIAREGLEDMERMRERDRLELEHLRQETRGSS
jgi:hypothetical protein